MQFAAGATPAQRGRALALGQAAAAAEVAPRLVLAKFAAGAGRSTGKAAKRVEQDPAVLFAEVCMTWLLHFGRRPPAGCLACHAGRNGHAATLPRMCLPAPPTTSNQPQGSVAPAQRAPAGSSAACAALRPLCVSLSCPQPNFIYTHSSSFVSNDTAYTGGSLWGM